MYALNPLFEKEIFMKKIGDFDCPFDAILYADAILESRWTSERKREKAFELSIRASERMNREEANFDKEHNNGY